MIGPIGRLRRRVALLRPDVAVDDAGVAATNFTTVATVWAAPLRAAAEDMLSAGADRSPRGVRYLIRRRSDIRVGWRLAEDGMSSAVTKLSDADDHGRFQIVEATEVTP
jgi:SPP1 family predicted phage head-tail adaptor